MLQINAFGSPCSATEDHSFCIGEGKSFKLQRPYREGVAVAQVLQHRQQPLDVAPGDDLEGKKQPKHQPLPPDWDRSEVFC